MTLLFRSAIGTVALAFMLSASADPPPLRYRSLTEAFDTFAEQTKDMPRDQRVALFRKKFARLFPGYYARRGRKDYNDLIARALDEFPMARPAYLAVEHSFPSAFAGAVTQFRIDFPDFTSPMPIWFLHSLGEMDGGTREIRGHSVAVFGADMIAKYDADRMQPFLDHELFHIEHARYFKDCDPMWCSLWQEGLAVYAASKMNPGATDHQLLLTEPKPLREPLDARWGEVLCITAANLDSTDPKVNAAFFFGQAVTPNNMPNRFGYYVAYRIVQRAGDQYGLSDLTRLNQRAARKLLAETISIMLSEAHANCLPG